MAVQAVAALSGERWEYAHSVFHAAGYALDPEYHEELMKEGPIPNVNEIDVPLFEKSPCRKKDFFLNLDLMLLS